MPSLLWPTSLTPAGGKGLVKCLLRQSLIPTTYKDVCYLEIVLIDAVLGCNVHLLPYLITITDIFCEPVG